MPYSSLEDFIKAADAIGEVEYVDGADLELEVGCLTELFGERGGPMPVFDKIPGYPAGYRVCSNTIKSMRRFCLALDLPLDSHPLELLRLWREKRKTAAADSRQSRQRWADNGLYSRRQRRKSRILSGAPLAYRRWRPLHRHRRQRHCRRP